MEPAGLPPLAPAQAEAPEGKKRRQPAKPRAPKKPKLDAGAAGDGAAGQQGPKQSRPRGRPPGQGREGAGGGKGRGQGGGGRGGRGGRRGKGREVDGDVSELVEIQEQQQEEPEETMGPSHRDIFAKDLPNIMYGYGDSSAPLKESVELLEDMAVDYVTDMAHKAMAVAHKRCAAALAARGGNMPAAALKREELLKLDDLLFVLRNDPRKYARVNDLLVMQEAIRKARALTKDDEGKVGLEGGDNMPDMDDMPG